MISVKRAKAEKNTGEKLTVPVRTRSPLEAFKMLEVGQNVDVMKGYYERKGVDVDKDFQLFDQIDKLKALNRYKEDLKVLESKLKSFEDERSKALAEMEKQKIIKEYESNRYAQSQGGSGKIPESGTNNPGEGKSGQS